MNWRSILAWIHPWFDVTQILDIEYTVCPGSSDPPEKILNIFASENEVYVIF